ncbi:hypothetical protein [Aquimarina sp. I32.4]|uniref:hypothetical protein n=1 Tax=Aquimarina sp. I32.4 TaxID=2053903 RepID=UPI0011AF8F1F|nr:hypothetical protein [Aquimarina sp. I32.4]
MKRRLTLILLILATSLQSCNFDTPENYFDRTTLNINKYLELGGKDFDSMKQLKSSNMLYGNVDGEYKPVDSYETHVRTLKIPTITEDLDKIKALKVTPDTKDLITASLDVFTFIKSTCEKDYIDISKLLDSQAPSYQIEAAIQKLENSLSEYDTKRATLMKIAKSYAEKHKINVDFGG